MFGRNSQIQPRQAGIATMLGTVLLKSASDDQNPVITGFPTRIGHGGIQSQIIEYVIPHNWYYFKTLKQEWHRERGATSSLTKSAMCYSYQRIIAMGDNAVPLILGDLKENQEHPDHWFWALRVLTNANPVPADHRGNFPLMARDWLEWAKTKNTATT